MFTVMIVLHLILHWSSFLSWVLFLADLGLMGWLAFNAYRDADTLDRCGLCWSHQLFPTCCFAHSC